MSNTFNNLESLGAIRTKLNANILTVENELTTKVYNYTTGADNASGNVTAQTVNSITDNTKTFIVNQWAGYAVKMITATGEEDYAVVASNTATQLTFDDNHAGFTFTSYRILSTFNVEDMTSVIAFTVTNDAAIVLPDVTTITDRSLTTIYLEVADGTKGVVTLCRGTQRQRGHKYGKLIYRYEMVSLLSHNTASPYWDIASLENIKRYGSLETNANISIASASYVPIIPFANGVLGQSRRFTTKNVSGISWLKYESIAALDFRLSGSIPVQRGGGGGTSLVEFKVRVKRFATGLNEDTTITAIASFSADNTQTIPIDIPFLIQPYDEITLIARRNSGTITMLSGASFVFTEM